jgi:hypothetical protein
MFSEELELVRLAKEIGFTDRYGVDQPIEVVLLFSDSRVVFFERRDIGFRHRAVNR